MRISTILALLAWLTLVSYVGQKFAVIATVLLLAGCAVSLCFEHRRDRAMRKKRYIVCSSSDPDRPRP